ncbi:uncharacterized protein [Macrobrachium rosenbergii]|uniref:uncharacterized protein n=1 Tax=Macrobrachium rosenbergii TaxID=79674 RepID=UPI0034D6BA99
MAGNGKYDKDRGKEIGRSRDQNVWYNKEDRIRNEYTRGSTKVLEISKKVQEGRLRWYGYLLRRQEHHIGKHAMEMELQGRRRRGRLRKRWRDYVSEGLREKGLDEAETHHRGRWKRRIQNGDPLQKWD